MLLEAAQGKQRLELVPKARSAVLSALEQARSLSVLEAREVVPLSASLLELEGELRSVLGGFDVRASFASSSDGSVGSFTGVEHHTLGRFRLSVTTSPRPVRVTDSVTPQIAQILSIAAASRTEAQANELAAFYRGIAPLLDSQRAELALG